MGEKDKMELIKFVDENFPCWKDPEKPTTYVTPPVLLYRAQDNYIPTKGASNYIPELYDDMDPHHYTTSVEEQVLNVFIRFGDYTNQPMFIFPNFKIKTAINIMKKYDLIEAQAEKLEQIYETDLIILHKRFGIILVEVKSNIKDYDEAKQQLEKRENILTSYTLCDNPRLCDDSELQKCFIKKVIACPCQYEPQELKGIKSEYIHLCKNHVNSFTDFKDWWRSTFESKTLYKTATDIELVYNNLVPKFICKRTEMYYNLSKDKGKQIQYELHLQKSLQRQIENTQLISKIKEAISKIIPEIVKAEKEIEKDNPEFEKFTLHIQKANGHIKQAVQKFKPNIIRCRTRIVSTDETSVLHKFWKYMTSEQSEVWNKERQIIYGPYGSGKTVLIQCKAADLALSGENVLIILPTHLMTSYENFFSTYASSDVTIYVRSELHASCIHEWSNIKDEKGVHGKIMLVSLKAFDIDYCKWFYEGLAYTSHIFSDELLCPPNTSDDLPENIREFFSLRNLLEKDSFSHMYRQYYFWIAPHAYIFLARSLTNKMAMVHSKLQLLIEHNMTCHHDHQPIAKSKCSLLMLYVFHMTKPANREDMLCNIEHKTNCNCIYILKFITTLSTTFRTTKHIHDFIVQKEWQDFCNYKLADKNLNMLFLNNVLEPLLCISHGHHINGPPVRIFSINYNKKLDKYNQEMKIKFLHSSVQVIWSEIERLCKKNYSIKPKEIAVIIDTCSIYAMDIRQSLSEKLNENCKSASRPYVFSSFKDEQDRDNTIVIYNSDDIASLEWPVVIHVKYFYYHNYELDSSGDLNYFESYHNMIASRCTMEYIIICCEDTEDAWPHNNSFQKFKLWCEEESGTDNAKLDVDAFKKYLKL